MHVSVIFVMNQTPVNFSLIPFEMFFFFFFFIFFFVIPESSKKVYKGLSLNTDLQQKHEYINMKNARKIHEKQLKV